MKRQYLHSLLLLILHQLLLTVYLCCEFCLHMDFKAEALLSSSRTTAPIPF